MRLSRYAAALLLALLLAAAPQGQAAAQSAERCFAETAQCIRGEIRTFWERNGGLPVFGLPLGPQQAVTEGGKTIQMQRFERNRIELHPENKAPYNVQLGRLGADRLAQQGRDWQNFERPAATAAGCRLFSQTGHTVCGEFLAAFGRYGLSFANTPGISPAESLALFGLPLSEAMTETIGGKEYTIQWFERARFELHPENKTPYNVLFGRLGAEIDGESAHAPVAKLAGTTWQLVSYGIAAAPVAATTTGKPPTLSFDATQVSGNTGCNGFGGAYQATERTITFRQVIGTLIACDEESIRNQERSILTALQGEVGYIIADGTLRISYSDGQALMYRQLAVVSGNVTYRQRVALPPEALIEVALVDVSRADAPAVTLAKTSIAAGGQQVPFSFILTYDPAQIDARGSYAVQARITVDSQLRFISTTRYSVITQGNPTTTVEVVVDPV